MRKAVATLILNVTLFTPNFLQGANITPDSNTEATYSQHLKDLTSLGLTCKNFGTKKALSIKNETILNTPEIFEPFLIYLSSNKIVELDLCCLTDINDDQLDLILQQVKGSLKKLTFLCCNKNLQEINLNNFPHLEEIEINGSEKLLKLNINHCHQLQKVALAGNFNMQNINFSDCPQLQEVTIYDCQRNLLKEIYVALFKLTLEQV